MSNNFRDIYKTYMKWFGRIIIGFIYIMFIAHLIRFKNIEFFLVGIIGITVFAFFWRFMFKIFLK